VSKSAVQMRFAVYGSGGVGGYFGACLWRAGHEVLFIARPGNHLNAMKEKGLTITGTKGKITVPAEQLNATDDPASVGKVDVVLVGVKAFQAREIAPHVKGMLKPDTVVVPLCNGIEAQIVLASFLGWDVVTGGLCKIFAYITEPGVITCESLSITPIIEFGPMTKMGHYADLFAVTPTDKGNGTVTNGANCVADGDAGNKLLSGRLQEVADVMNACEGMEAIIPEDIEMAMWRKFLGMGAFGPSMACFRAPLPAAASIPECVKVIKAALNEIVAVAKAYGVQLGESEAETMAERAKTFPKNSTPSTLRYTPTRVHTSSRQTCILLTGTWSTAVQVSWRS